ncbi:threonine/serine dehydratase [Actibacterium sp. XHP0104]|uniref:threonine ammonia-lyase n=1 Tax=Actibacterium sp. XHP0104 TaxID=2984335 RepID=UPI0021E75691|nr:threonine/serine dehydratase [Actibacterium sp. XHP0104]MCV2882207.1 threonine/serine dehydratase [Actibacterium sp. XHP0104]
MDDIHAAAARLEGRAIRTPLLNSSDLDALAGRRVLIKPECLQRTGSFKFRGAWAALSGLPEQDRTRGVIAYSSGNHAQGVALAARMLGVPAVIVMPADAPALKLANTRALGAEVVTYDRTRENREEIGQTMARDRGLVLIKPYDDPRVIAGQASVGLEIAEDAARLGVATADVLVPCGGGGLTSGIALALEAHAPGLRVRPVEPVGFDDTGHSLVAGQVLRNAALTGSICDAILTPQPGDLTFPIMQRLCDPGLSVTDAQALQAMALAMLRLKIVVEPGGAVALAAALFQPDAITGDTVIVVASGGNTDPDMMARALTTLP